MTVQGLNDASHNSLICELLARSQDLSFARMLTRMPLIREMVHVTSGIVHSATRVIHPATFSVYPFESVMNGRKDYQPAGAMKWLWGRQRLNKVLLPAASTSAVVKRLQPWPLLPPGLEGVLLGAEVAGEEGLPGHRPQEPGGGGV